MELGTAAATAPVAACFKNPRRSMDVLSSAIGTLRHHYDFLARPEFTSWHPRVESILHRPTSAGLLVLSTPSSRPLGDYNGRKSYGWSSAFALGNGLSHDFPHP